MALDKDHFRSLPLSFKLTNIAIGDKLQAKRVKPAWGLVTSIPEQCFALNLLGMAGEMT